MGLFSKKRVFARGKTLYFPGLVASSKLRHVVAATKSVLADMGVSYVMLDEFRTAGYHAYVAGYAELFRELKDQNLSLLDREGITRIVTNDPHEAWILKEEYGVETLLTVELFSQLLEKVRKGGDVKANYHHPCFLSKLGVAPRIPLRVLRRAGVHVGAENVAEGCCGSVGDDFARNNKEAAARIAKRRLADFQEKLLVTCCPYCLLAFKGQRRQAKDVAELLSEVE